MNVDPSVPWISIIGMASFRTRWWLPYLTIQAIGLFHLFYPLPYHYRHTVAKWAASPVLLGFEVGYTADTCFRDHRITNLYAQRLTLVDNCFIIFIAELINCGLFALAVLIVRYLRRSPGLN